MMAFCWLVSLFLGPGICHEVLHKAMDLQLEFTAIAALESATGSTYKTKTQAPCQGLELETGDRLTVSVESKQKSHIYLLMVHNKGGSQGFSFYHSWKHLISEGAQSKPLIAQRTITHEDSEHQMLVLLASPTALDWLEELKHFRCSLEEKPNIVAPHPESRCEFLLSLSDGIRRMPRAANSRGRNHCTPWESDVFQNNGESFRGTKKTSLPWLKEFAKVAF